MLKGWSAQALNTAPDSANEIHGDKIAKQYGFKGGLVPGVTISAYLMQPAVDAWGMDFLERGVATVRVASPLYDGEQFSVDITDQSGSAYTAVLVRQDGTVSANAEVGLGAIDTPRPVRRMDVVAERDYQGPVANFETFARLREQGCMAFRYRWGNKHRMNAYLRDASAMPLLLQENGGGYANMSFLLGCSNWVLASNARMNPWVHLETRSRNFGAVPSGTSIIAEMEVLEFYEKKGHEFIDCEVRLFNEAGNACLATIFLRAIYRLRGM